jgi:hypothetical protein
MVCLIIITLSRDFENKGQLTQINFISHELSLSGQTAATKNHSPGLALVITRKKNRENKNRRQSLKWTHVLFLF